MGQVLYKHNLLCNNHGVGEMSVDVAQQDVEQDNQHEAGGAVYVHCLCPLASLQGLPCWLVQGKQCVVALSSREN